MTGPFVVVLRDQQLVYGPFSDKAEADWFAAYLQDEVDPVTVQEVRSPVRDLLAWRDEVKARGGGL